MTSDCEGVCTPRQSTNQEPFGFSPKGALRPAERSEPQTGEEYDEHGRTDN